MKQNWERIQNEQYPSIHDGSLQPSGSSKQLFPKFINDGSYSVPRKGEPSLFQASFKIFSAAC